MLVGANESMRYQAACAREGAGGEDSSVNGQAIADRVQRARVEESRRADSKGERRERCMRAALGGATRFVSSRRHTSDAMRKRTLSVGRLAAQREAATCVLRTGANDDAGGSEQSRNGAPVDTKPAWAADCLPSALPPSLSVPDTRATSDAGPAHHRGRGFSVSIDQCHIANVP